MVDTLAFVIVFAAMVCAVVGFVYARRVFVAQRNKDFERSQIYGISTKKRSAAGRMQTKSGTWLEAKLLFAGVGLAPSVFVFSVLITGLLVGTLLQSIMPGFGFVVGVVAAAVGAWVFLGVAANKRSADFDKQLAAALPMVAENLRGGSGLETSISAVAQFMPDPLHSELNRVIDDVATTSLSLPEALERLGTRVDSKEVRFLATSFLIQREGGRKPGEHGRYRGRDDRPAYRPEGSGKGFDVQRALLRDFRIGHAVWGVCDLRIRYS